MPYGFSHCPLLLPKFAEVEVEHTDTLFVYKRHAVVAVIIDEVDKRFNVGAIETPGSVAHGQ